MGLSEKQQMPLLSGPSIARGILILKYGPRTAFFSVFQKNNKREQNPFLPQEAQPFPGLDVAHHGPEGPLLRAHVPIETLGRAGLRSAPVSGHTEPFHGRPRAFCAQGSVF